MIDSGVHTNPTHFFMLRNDVEIQGALVSGRRWIIGSSVGRALNMSVPKAFGKTLRRKPAMQSWTDSMVTEGVSINRENKFYVIQRRVMSAEIAAFSVGNMRVSETQIRIFRMLLAIHALGFDLSVAERTMEDMVRSGLDVGINISF